MASANLESLYQIIANAPYAVALLNKQLQYVTASQKWVDDFQLYGPLSGKSHLEVFPGIGPEWLAIYQDALQGKLRKSEAEHIASLDGSLQWLKWEVQPCFDHLQQVTGLVLYLENQTRHVEEKEDLQRKLDLYEQTNKVARVGAWEFDFVQSELYWSPVTKQIHEVEENFIPDLHAAIEFFKAGDNRNKITSCFGNAFAAGTPYTEDLQLITARGNEIWVKVHGSAEFINGICVRVYGTFQEITERKEADELIKRTITANKLAANLISEERNLLSTLIENIPINIYIKDLELRKTRANRAEVEYMKGLCAGDIIGKTDFELFPEDTAANSFAEDQEVLTSGVPMISRESADKKPDGTVNYLLTSKIPLKNNNDEVVGLLGISYDITKIKEAEHALAVSEEKYREIFENIQDIYYRTDKYGIVIEISPSIEKYYNYKRAQIIGSPVTDFYYYQEDRDVIVEVLKHNHAVTDFEVKLKTRNNGLVYASVNARLIIKDGIVVGSEGSIRDITARKAQEMELTELNTELKALNAHKEKLLSVIGHDLRNPIAASLKLAELALMDIDDISKEELLEYLSKMEIGLQNANELLENLLQWAKNQFNTLNFNPVLIHDLAVLIAGCIKRIRPVADAKNIKLVTNVPAGIKMYADQDMLDAIIRNLVSNAIKFTTDGQITVEVQIREYDLLFSVTDNGTGISADRLEQLFNKSFSYSTYGTSGEKGTGLGLELCRDFVEKHQGRIWVQSEQGKGSTFYFTTPI